MNDMQNGFFPAADGLKLRYGIWRCPSASHGTVLLLNGRKEFLEKYQEVASRLNSRGLDVFGMDWRGQGLSGRMLEDTLKGHVNDFDEYMEDLELFLSRVVLPKSRHRQVTILAHSMGAHMALRFLREYDPPVQRCVLSAPMIDIRSNPFSKAVIRWLARSASRKGRLAEYVPGARGGSRLHKTFSGNLLTSDKKRFFREQAAIEAEPGLALGGVTQGWVSAALRSIDTLLRKGYPEKIDTPVLLAVAEKELIVCRKAQLRLARRLPHSRVLVIPGARHEILMERDELQQIFWDAFDDFILSQGQYSG